MTRGFVFFSTSPVMITHSLEILLSSMSRSHCKGTPRAIGVAPMVTAPSVIIPSFFLFLPWMFFLLPFLLLFSFLFRWLFFFFHLSDKCWTPTLLLFNCEVMTSSLRSHGLQHVRLPCPSLSPRVWSNSCSLSRWCHPTMSSSVVVGIKDKGCMSPALPLGSRECELGCELLSVSSSLLSFLQPMPCPVMALRGICLHKS